MMQTGHEPFELSPWDAAEALTTPARIAAFLEAVFEDGDADEIKHALGVAARARGMTKIARETGLTREALYKALQADGDPKFSTLIAVMRALGLRLVAKPAKARPRSRKQAA
jgi:probable addiction module antidote protein